MKLLPTILLFLFLVSCNITFKADSVVSNKDSILVDSLFGPGIWNKYFEERKTLLGATIKLQIVNDSSYQILWGKSSDYRIYYDTFRLDGHETWIPKFIAENRNYIVMRQGCGNPCWRGYFLPLNDSIKPSVINEYLDFDLDHNLVASIKDSNIIEIKNLKTNRIEDYIINGCKSSFIGYCIDSLSIKDRTLKFKWIPETRVNSNKGYLKIVKLKL